VGREKIKKQVIIHNFLLELYKFDKPTSLKRRRGSSLLLLVTESEVFCTNLSINMQIKLKISIKPWSTMHNDIKKADIFNSGFFLRAHSYFALLCG